MAKAKKPAARGKKRTARKASPKKRTQKSKPRKKGRQAASMSVVSLSSENQKSYACGSDSRPFLANCPAGLEDILVAEFGETVLQRGQVTITVTHQPEE